MPDYRKMYAILCAAASDAVDLLREGRQASAEETLLAALSRAEELYIAAHERTGEVISLFPGPEEENL